MNGGKQVISSKLKFNFLLAQGIVLGPPRINHPHPFGMKMPPLVEEEKLKTKPI
jgi:hypothetical protein